jgi:hypothetical protein
MGLEAASAAAGAGEPNSWAGGNAPLSLMGHCLSPLIVAIAVMIEAGAASR